MSDYLQNLWFVLNHSAYTLPTFLLFVALGFWFGFELWAKLYRQLLQETENQVAIESEIGQANIEKFMATPASTEIDSEELAVDAIEEEDVPTPRSETFSVYYQMGGSITPEGRDAIEKAASLITECGNSDIMIIGYSKSEDSADEYDELLSQALATDVADRLADLTGNSDLEMACEGRGEDGDFEATDDYSARVDIIVEPV